MTQPTPCTVPRKSRQLLVPHACPPPCCGPGHPR